MRPLSDEQREYLELWERAVRLTEGTDIEPSDVYHCLANLRLTPEERLDAGFIRIGRFYRD